MRKTTRTLLVTLAHTIEVEVDAKTFRALRPLIGDAVRFAMHADDCTDGLDALDAAVADKLDRMGVDVNISSPVAIECEDDSDDDDEDDDDEPKRPNWHINTQRRPLHH